MKSDTWKLAPMPIGLRYEVSSSGLVRTIKLPHYYLNPKPDHKGYLRTTIRIEGVRHNIAIHRLVLETFIGPCPDGHVANHKNCNKADNRLENLEWVSQLYNVGHAIEHGHFFFSPIGESHPGSKLTSEQVLEIRQLYDTGQYTKVALGQMFGVSDSNIRAIVFRRAWKHI